MNELVLGGAGLIGRELVRELEVTGANVRIIDLRIGLDAVTVGREPYEWADRVWFLAWDTGGSKFITKTDRQHEIFRNNSLLCSRVFDEIHSTRTASVFVTSQLAGQRNAYGLTKLIGEEWAAAVGATTARLWNVYGFEPPELRSHVISDFVFGALSKGVVSCTTTGKERRRFLHKTDCARALLIAAESDLLSVDICGDRWFEIAEIAELVGSVAAAPTSFGTQLGEEMLVEPTNLLPNWRPQVGLEDGVRQVWGDAASYVRGLREA